MCTVVSRVYETGLFSVYFGYFIFVDFQFDFQDFVLEVDVR